LKNGGMLEKFAQHRMRDHIESISLQNNRLPAYLIGWPRYPESQIPRKN